MSDVEARVAMEIGMEVAKKYQTAVMEMAKQFPDATLEQLMRGNSVGLGTLIMRVLMDAKIRATP